MTRDAWGFKRIADRYEIMFRDDFWKVLREKDFHIEQLKMSIDAADELLDVVGEDIKKWSEAVQEVYEVDDADTLWRKIQWAVMKKYVDYRQSLACNESRDIGLQRERLVALLKILYPTYERDTLRNMG